MTSKLKRKIKQIKKEEQLIKKPVLSTLCIITKWFSLISFLCVLNIWIEFSLIVSNHSSYILPVSTQVTQYYRFVIFAAIAFFYFTFRERSSVSNRNDNGRVIINFISYSLLFILLGMALQIFLSSEIKLTNYILAWVEVIAWAFLIFFFLSFFSLLKAISNSLKNLIFKHSLAESRRAIEELFQILIEAKDLNDQEKKILFDRLSENVEGYYQSIIYSLQNSLENSRQNDAAKWEALVGRLMEDSGINNEPYYLYPLYNLDKGYTNNFYSTLINKHVEVIFELYKMSRFKEVEDARRMLRNYEPPDYNLNVYRSYVQTLEAYYVEIFKNATYSIEDALKELKSFGRFIVEEENIFDKKEYIHPNNLASILIHQTLLKDAVEENSIKKVTDITYSLTNEYVMGKESPAKSIKKEVAPSRKNYEEIMKEAMISQEVKDKDQEKKKQISNKSIIICTLLQALFKSVEIGHYSATGQLVKRLITDFSGSELNPQLKKFKEEQGELRIKSPDPQGKINFDFLVTDFGFNEQSFNYCYDKMLVILYIQQKYIIKEKLKSNKFYKKFDGEDDFVTDLIIGDVQSIKYITKKLKNASNDYGLLSLTEDKFLKRSVHDLIRTISK